MPFSRLAALYLSVLLSACSERNVHDATEFSEPAEPTYEPQAPLRGVYRWGFETSALHLCNTTRDRCLNAIETDEGCWVEFTESAYRQLSLLREDSYERDEYAEVWLEGSGRLAEQPGNFGHLGAYACQVELTAVHAIDGGPPWVFRPPPP